MGDQTTSKKRDDIALVDAFTMFPPNRQPVLNNNDLFYGAIMYRVRRIEQQEEQERQREQEERDREEREQEEEREQQAEQEQQALQEQQIREEQETGTASTQPSDMERADRCEREKKRKKRKRSLDEGIQATVPRDLLRRLSPVFTQLNISHNAAVTIISAVYNECDVDLDDVVVSASSSKRIRCQENELMSDKALSDLTEKVMEVDAKLTLHYDTALLDQRMDNIRETKDRLSLVVSSPDLEKPHLLCMPGLKGGTAVEQATEAHNVLCRCNLVKHVIDLVYDTTAVNTGRHGGTVKLLQMLKGTAML